MAFPSIYVIQLQLDFICSDPIYSNPKLIDHLVVITGDQSDCLTLKVLVATIDPQWEVMGDVGSARYELALLPPCPTIRVLSYSN